ncbi:pyrroline-5-carboxylate reductase [Desulfosarcina sp. BuS5]|uniref:pyrroline-5-carboxylate reductase n=1 Tax=Desulfosarcina sp. BuS5 TaxID=933262 RepID=UPI0004882577|nr:pyrroline-5-carboxylate reductase [Desulfosarcina sp. BuS5]WDN90484.1 pyrroline-5-carboxylate reductase [Desulfosarcina sp. BuS5]
MKKIGFIGAGNMGEAFIGSIIKSGIFPPSSISASDINKEHLKFLKSQYDISVTDDNFRLFTESDIVILAVKPQQMVRVLSEIIVQKAYNVTRRKLVISIAAGITIKKIEELLYGPLDENQRGNLPIIRVMPNTPVLVLKGMSGLSPNRYVTQEELDAARTILEATGKALEFSEKLMDAVTALSGSGPAYVFYMVESMIKGGVDAGLTPEDSRTLSIATLKGALALMEELKELPESLRAKVTSPGGTTEAAIQVMEDGGIKKTIIKAIAAAVQRSKNLGQ